MNFTELDSQNATHFIVRCKIDKMNIKRRTCRPDLTLSLLFFLTLSNNPDIVWNMMPA